MRVSITMSMWPFGADGDPTLLTLDKIVDAADMPAESRWTLSDAYEPLDLSGHDTRQLLGWYKAERVVSHQRMRHELRRGHGVQMIDGTLAAVDRDGATILKITAVDSTWYEVVGAPDIVNRITRVLGWAMAHGGSGDA